MLGKLADERGRGAARSDLCEYGKVWGSAKSSPGLGEGGPEAPERSTEGRPWPWSLMAPCGRMRAVRISIHCSGPPVPSHQLVEFNCGGQGCIEELESPTEEGLAPARYQRLPMEAARCCNCPLQLRVTCYLMMGPSIGSSSEHDCRKELINFPYVNPVVSFSHHPKPLTNNARAITMNKINKTNSLLMTMGGPCSIQGPLPVARPEQ